MYWTCGSGLVELEMTLDQAQSVSHQGRCDADVADLRTVPKIKRQLAKLDPIQVAHTLRGYGAWDETELADHDANLNRLVWIAGCDLAEEAATKRRKQRTYSPSR